MTDAVTQAVSAPLPGVERVAVIGLGLIGGSIARGLAAAGFAGELVGGVADAGQAERARALELVARAETDPGAAVAGADLVIVAVPLGAVESVFAAIAPALGDDAVVTDVGSAKACVVAAAGRALGAAADRFVPGHPIAGTEHNGLEAGFARLFVDHRVVLTPEHATRSAAIARVRALWTALGGHVYCMTAAAHDRVLAATSHLPHALAFTLVDALADMNERDAVFDYAAGGFADFTRIAASDPVVWRDIFTYNRSALLPAIDAYIADLGALRAAVAAGDGDALAALMARANDARRAFAPANADP